MGSLGKDGAAARENTERGAVIDSWSRWKWLRSIIPTQKAAEVKPPIRQPGEEIDIYGMALFMQVQRRD